PEEAEATTPPPSPPAPPTPPTEATADDDAILPPLLHRFATAVAPQIEGDAMPVVFCLLTALGNVIGRDAHIVIGADRHYANLFATLVAGSGIGKSEPHSVVNALMGYVAPDWKDNAIVYGLGSGEGLIQRLQDGSDKRCFIHEAEFGSVLTRGRREGSTLSG